MKYELIEIWNCGPQIKVCPVSDYFDHLKHFTVL